MKPEVIRSAKNLPKSCQVIFDKDRIDAEAARLTVGMKATKRGQVCINADCCMVPEDSLDDFVALMKKDIEDNGLADNNMREHSCAIVSDHHLARADAMLAEAEERGATLITPGKDDYAADRCMPFKLVLNAPADSALMTLSTPVQNCPTWSV